MFQRAPTLSSISLTILFTKFYRPQLYGFYLAGEEMQNTNNPQVRDAGLVVQELPNEVLIYDLNTNKAHCLNDTAAVVWRACDGTNSVADIVKGFERSGGGKVTEDFVWLAIDQLNENGLLQPGTASRFAGHSRRDVLKKIGLASIVALPVIASLVAPKSALASGSCACTTVSQCQGGLVPVQCQTGFCGGGGQCATPPPGPGTQYKSKKS